MKTTIHDVEQRSETWHALRLGRLTSSVADDMLAITQGGKPSTSRQNLLVRLVLEEVTQRSHERGFFVTQAMQDGIDREDDALVKYEEMTGRLVYPCGFISCDDIKAGTSPDGLVGEDGAVSIKCPIPATHWKFLRTGEIPLAYQRQNAHELWITGRQWIDFFSYQPDFADLGLDCKLVRVERDEAAIRDYERKALAFLAEVETEVQAVRTMANLRGTLVDATEALAAGALVTMVGQGGGGGRG